MVLSRRFLLPFLVSLTCWLAGCSSAGRLLERVVGDGPPADSTVAFTVYLVGDGGDNLEDQMPTMGHLRKVLAGAGPNSAVVFLGDNIYPSGLPPASSPARIEAEKRLDGQLAVVDSFAGRVVIVPGNHDWGGVGLGGDRAAVLRQERYVEQKLERGNTFLPDNGYPGPAVVALTDSLTLIALDTQWWMEESKPYGDTGQYLLEQETELLIELDDVLRRHRDTNLLVVAHHPLFTNGPHGGFFPGVRRFNPFTVFSRRYLGTPQDLSNYKYRRLREGLLALFAQHEGLIYAAGHEHALQHFPYDDDHHIVSGAASKTSYVEQGHGAAFVDEGKGYATLRYHTDGSVWLSFWRAEDDGPEARLLYREQIRKGNRPPVAFRPYVPAPVAAPPQARNGTGADDTSPAGADTMAEVDATAEADTTEAAVDPDIVRPEVVAPVTSRQPAATEGRTPDVVPYKFFSEGTITVRAAPEYKLGAVGKFFFGQHYRDAWQMPVEVPIIDLERTAGGLSPIKRGGGLQTVSLRLRGADGDEYVLRSINKDPGKALPDYLLKTLAHDVVQDQVSAMHPYAAFTLPKMAEAVGVLHTYPTLVYVPASDRLGIYKEDFSGMLALFEARPDEAQRDEPRFGHAENIVGSPKLFEEIEEDNDEFVDQEAFARARLFDMLIGDWDRHSDQWRWAAFEPGDLDSTLEGDARTQGKIYRPIPRDRDFTYFRFDGVLARLARMTGIQQFRRFVNFFRGYHDLYGLNFNGAAMDRRFTSKLTGEDWQALAEDIRARLTDDVIDAAMRDFPPAIHARQGAEIAAMLRQRRDELPRAAAEYYESLAHVVDIVGSDKHERFEVTRKNDRETEVVMFKTKKDGEIDRALYRRTFLSEETDEVRLYGLGGNDAFIVRGDVRNGILVRAIGGTGDDTFVDSSRVAGPKRHTIFHDTRSGNTWATGSETYLARSDDPVNNRYEMLRFEDDLMGPFVTFGRDIDDGVEVGAGLKIIEQGFRKQPHAGLHQLGVQYGTRSKAVHAFYEGHVRDYMGIWDGHLGAEYTSERQYSHFYGLGNSTELEDRFRYQARLAHATVAPSLSRTLVFPFIRVSGGARFVYAAVAPPADAAPTAFSPDTFVDKYWAGLDFGFEADGTDSLSNTRSGARWRNTAQALVGVRNTDAMLLQLASSLSYFYTFDLPTQVTLASRVGGALNLGQFEFYQANTLGGEENLRGYRKTRFAGRASFYHNLDLRLKLFDFNAYLTRGDFGVLGFVDHGRVWSDGERSGRWHRGYGGGLWASPFYRLVLTATLARSREDTLFDVSFGFLF